MLTRYIRDAMKRARLKTLGDGTCFGEIPGLAGVWANEETVVQSRVSDSQTDYPQRADPAFPEPGFTGPISGGRHQIVERGELKVRIQNPHKGSIGPS